MKDLLDFLKNGSGIHIKKKNRGKFTSYCGGKVTDECIRRGKNSSSATIRKRATFAANARKWKHKFGGIVKAQEGDNTSNWFTNALNSKGGQFALTALTSLAKNYSQNKLISEQAKQQAAQSKMAWEQRKKQLIDQAITDANSDFQKWVNNYKQGFINDNPSDIVSRHRLQERTNELLGSSESDYNNQIALNNAYLQSQKTANTMNMFSNIIEQLPLLFNNKNNQV